VITELNNSTGHIDITATSVNDCTITISLDQAAAAAQYGVVNATACASDQTLTVDRQPVMFWYYHINADNQRESKTVFCEPKIEAFQVTGHASLNNDSITSCEKTGDYSGNPPIDGPPFNA
jgi:hypothetical protein